MDSKEERTMRRAIREYVLLGLAVSTAVGVSLVGLGCSHTPVRPVALEEARAAYAQAQGDPQVATNAPVALRDAEEAVRRAEQAWEKDKELREVQNLAAVAKRRVEVARAAADKKRAEEEVARLGAERDRVLLDARTRQAERAQREADQAYQQVRAVTSRDAQLEQELAALQAQVRETERGLVLTLGDILFGSGQVTLTPGAMRRLQPLVTVLRAHPERQVTIEGYTDSMGSESYNLGLSQRRAEAVRDFLIQNGVDASRIIARGYGAAAPVAPNTTEAGRQQNRRVEVIIGRS
jgi:OmpA-OmpF porin, OOP family